MDIKGDVPVSRFWSTFDELQRQSARAQTPLKFRRLRLERHVDTAKSTAAAAAAADGATRREARGAQAGG